MCLVGGYLVRVLCGDMFACFLNVQVLSSVSLVSCYAPQVVIDAFRLINPQLMMLGQEPRQTTSNIGHLNKPSVQVGKRRSM